MEKNLIVNELFYNFTKYYIFKHIPINTLFKRYFFILLIYRKEYEI